MILQLQNISFGYSPDKQILNDLSLSLEEKKIYALMGSNGAGKTSLFNLITGFIKPQSGEIYFFRKNLNHLRPYKINRKGIGRTFQDLRLITKLTVKENIILGMQNNPTGNWLIAMLPEKLYLHKNQVFEKRADEIIEQFFLKDVRNSLTTDVSYGQQKLLSLACCVSNGAKLMLLDEAVAGVQPEYRNKIVLLIKELKEQGKTILLIEHNTDFINDVADKIFFLHQGKISTFEDIQSLRKDKEAINTYI